MYLLNLLKRLARVAAAAVSSKFTVVDIVTGMAIAATAAERRLDVQRLPVAGLAADGAVRAVEAESGLCVVVKAPFRPVDGRMTQRAVLAKAAVMWLVFAVAGVAVFGGISKNLCFVTSRALGVRVLAEQRESRQVMIEENVLGPGFVIVAVVAR